MYRDSFGPPPKELCFKEQKCALKFAEKCGKNFYTETGRSGTYLCPDCSLQSKWESVYRKRVCKLCGESFTGYPGSLFYLTFFDLAY